MDEEREAHNARLGEAHARRLDTIAAGAPPADDPTAVHGAVAQPEPASHLTERELDVLALVARGLSNDEVAVRLGIGMETVKTHLVHISARLGARNRAHAVYLACSRGILNGRRVPRRG